MAQEHGFRKAEVSAATRQADAFERIADSLDTLVKWITTPPYIGLADLAVPVEDEKIADHNFTPAHGPGAGLSRRCAFGIGGGEVCGEYMTAHLRAEEL